MNEQLSDAVHAQMPDARVEALVEGNRAQITVVSERFAGLSRVARQQAVYACIGDFISDGRLHAVSIRALTPDEAG